MKSPGPAPTRPLRPRTKVLPGQARAHNRALVLQTVLHSEGLSRADVARATGLTRVTVSDLVAELIESGLLREAGPREDSRPGKPAILLEVDVEAHQVIGLDLSGHTELRGALLRLDGTVVRYGTQPLAGRKGEAALEAVHTLITELRDAATSPVLGIGVGTPGVVDLGGTILAAHNLGWTDLPLQRILRERYDLPVVLVNDADAAALAVHSFDGASGDLILVTIGHGVGASLVIGGMAVRGAHQASGEIGHVTVGTDGGPLCACGRYGCLESWLSAPRLEEALAQAQNEEERHEALAAAGRRLGIALAPVVGALDLAELILSGPAHLVEGPLTEATSATLQERTLPTEAGHAVVRSSPLGPDIVLRGAAAGVVSQELGVS